MLLQYTVRPGALQVYGTKNSSTFYPKASGFVRSWERDTTLSTFTLALQEILPYGFPTCLPRQTMQRQIQRCS